MQAEIEIVTVAYAKQLLAQNPTNRRVSKNTVNRYAADMKAGRWANNGQGIAISPDGKLLDGQHRMHAIVQSQTPISMVVVRGVPADVFATIDSGKPRTLSDVLSIEGHPHATVIAGIARVSYNYASGQTFNYQATKVALADFVEAHPYAVEAAALVHQGSRQFPKIPLATTIFLGNQSRAYDAAAKAFAEGVLFGEGMWKGDARLTLREWVANQRVKGRGTVRSYALFAATARAWNAYARGQELLVIKCIESPTRRSLPIVGFDRGAFLDVPDLAAKAPKARRTNLPRLAADNRVAA